MWQQWLDIQGSFLLYELEALYKSFYIYVCSNWNYAYDEGANLNAITNDCFS